MAREASVVIHGEPASRARVVIQQPAGHGPSHKAHTEIGEEGQTVRRQDGMKTRITIGAPAPEQLGPATVQASPQTGVQTVQHQDAMNTRVSIQGHAPSNVEQKTVMQKTPAQLVAELKLLIEQDEVAVQRAEKRLDQRHNELAEAEAALELWNDAQAEQEDAARKAQQDAIEAAAAAERAKLEAADAAAAAEAAAAAAAEPPSAAPEGLSALAAGEGSTSDAPTDPPPSGGSEGQ